MKRLSVGATTGDIVAAINALVDERNEYEEAAEAMMVFSGEEDEAEVDPHVDDVLDNAVIVALNSLSHDARDGELSIVDQQKAAATILDYDLHDSNIRLRREGH